MPLERESAKGRAAGSPPMSLREACVAAGLDRGGERCPDCPVNRLCRSELRWLVRAVPERGEA